MRTCRQRFDCDSVFRAGSRYNLDLFWCSQTTENTKRMLCSTNGRILIVLGNNMAAVMSCKMLDSLIKPKKHERNSSQALFSSSHVLSRGAKSLI